VHTPLRGHIIANLGCIPEASKDAEEGLAARLKGLEEYKAGEAKRGSEGRDELLRGVSDCQKGSR